MKPLGIYIHYPFCISKCPFCDFYSKTDKALQGEYIDALINHIKLKQNKDYCVDTVYFGGGTPSLLGGEDMKRIIFAIDKSFYLDKNAEITIEANPKTVDFEKLSAFYKAGVGRISFGVQSIHENELKRLGRLHSFADFSDNFNSARNAGFDNISVDFLYGIPEQNMESLYKTVEKIIELSPEHISFYGLKLEENTPFWRKRDKLFLPDDDTQADMYEYIAKALKNAGYLHYEISNFAKCGYECRHNLKYWQSEEYLSFGAAAHSYFDGVRYSYKRDAALYIEKYACEEAIIDEKELLSPDDIEKEYIFLALRLGKGLSLSDYKAKFSSDFLEKYDEILAKFTDGGFMKGENGYVFLTEKGFLVANYILSEFV